MRVKTLIRKLQQANNPEADVVCVSGEALQENDLLLNTVVIEYDEQGEIEGVR